MKILVLEDDAERIHYFSKVFVKHELAIVNHVNMFAILCKKKFDIIFLDHDLGGEVYVESKHENTGYNACKFLVETINVNTPIIVHSYNENGAKNMMNLLKEEHQDQKAYQPFGSNEFVSNIELILRQG